MTLNQALVPAVHEISYALGLPDTCTKNSLVCLREVKMSFYLSFERSLTNTACTQRTLLPYNHETITEVINCLI